MTGPPRDRDHYGDGDWYDAEYVHIRADLALYRAVAREARDAVLELGCGTGRIAFAMAEEGAEVVGVDRAVPMLDRARAKLAASSPELRSRLSFVEADMRTVRLEGRFDRVVIGLNTLLHMTEDDDLEATFETAKAHLRPGGRFVFDIFSPPDGFGDRDPEGRFEPQQLIDPRTRERWIVTENNHYDRRRQLNHMVFYYRRADRSGEPTGPEYRARVTLRVLYPRELDRFIRQAGFRIEAEHEDFARTRPYTASGGLRVVELGLATGASSKLEPS